MSNQISGSPPLTGTHINYCMVCKRKLWLFAHNIQMEHASDLVSLGRLLHEQSYEREKKEIEVEGIKIDFMTKPCMVHEVKKSRKIEEAHIFQMLYYLHTLKLKGVDAKGIINYPLLRRTHDVELTAENEMRLESVIAQAQQTMAMQTAPPAVRLPYCRRCSYYDFCWS